MNRLAKGWARTRRLHQHPATRRGGRGVGIVAVAVAGVVLGILLAGPITTDLGPFRAHLSITPSLTGGTDVEIPPLGSLRLHSHAGPAHLQISLDTLDQDRARAVVNDHDGLARASDGVPEDLADGILRLSIRVVGAALLGALVLAGLIYRSMVRVAISGGVALGLLTVTGAVAALTFQPTAIQEPRYEGLLTNAPAVVGDARRIADKYEEYRAELQRLVTNVSRLYGTVSSLPVYESGTSTTRVLHISDMHLNPAAWSVVETVVKQFDIDVVVDTGDLTDWGTEPETSYVASIAKLGLPYLYIRGNHDSPLTAAAVARQPNATVLDNSLASVAGLTFAGIRDPRFTPDKSTDQNAADRELLVASGAQLAETILGSPTPVDVALVHDPQSSEQLAFACPVILAGHLHRREVRRLDGPPGGPTTNRSLLMVEGSTGAAGLRGLDNGKPLPLEMSVLYFDEQRALQAYDDVTVGGTGLSQVSLERHLVETDRDGKGSPAQSSSPSPGSSGSASTSGSSPPRVPPSGRSAPAAQPLGSTVPSSR